MGGRESGETRRGQIVVAALELLADTPLEQLSTRPIAARLGLTQPALFRHFRSREEILLAVVAAARAELAAIAEAVLAEAAGPRAQLVELACRLAGHVERHPGLPRLLFLLPEPGEVRDALGRMLTMQSSLVAELVREGQRRGELAASADPVAAATAFLGLLQGLALRAQLEPAAGSLPAQARVLVEQWLEGTRSRDGQVAAAPASADPVGIVALDVRPILAGGRDPLDDILAALAPLTAGELLLVTVPFRPAPLLALLGGRGHRVAAREAAVGVWSMTVVVGGEPAIVDLTELEAPEPLERVLEATARLASGAGYLARLPRFPAPLLDRLAERALRHAVERDVDGSAYLRVWREAG